MDFLHIVKPESMGESVNTSTWYGDVVNVHDISIILLGGIVARGCIELVESAVSDNDLDPGVRIWKVSGLAGGAQISGVCLFHSCELSEPEAGEVSVVYGDLWLGVGLRVRADEAAPWATLVSGLHTLCWGLPGTMGGLPGSLGRWVMCCILGRLPGTLGWWVVLPLVSVIGYLS